MAHLKLEKQELRKRHELRPFRIPFWTLSPMTISGLIFSGTVEHTQLNDRKEKRKEKKLTLYLLENNRSKFARALQDITCLFF